MFILNTLDEDQLRQTRIRCFGRVSASLAEVVDVNLSPDRGRICEAQRFHYLLPKSQM
jgi:hypothetical protein